MEVHGIDMAKGAYRVSFARAGRTIRGLVPEALVAADLGLAGRPPHGAVYAWIARHRAKIEAALYARATGGAAARAPFDILSLDEE